MADKWVSLEPLGEIDKKCHTLSPIDAIQDREPPRHIGIIARSNGPCFSPISRHAICESGPYYFIAFSSPLNAGQGPFSVMYPVSLKQSMSALVPDNMAEIVSPSMIH